MVIVSFKDMEEQIKDLREYIDAFRRRRNAVLVVAAAFFAVSLAAALFWPPVYSSAATILIEEQEIPPDMVRSAITTYAAQRIQSISQRVLTRPNLMQIVEKYDLYRNERRRDTADEIMDRIRKDIKVETVSADVVDPRSGRPTPVTIAFTLTYEGQQPELTQKVTSELTSLFLNENLKSRTEKASQTYDFLSAESEKLGEHINELEAKLAAYKEKNVNRLPELTQLNMQLLDRTENSLRDIESQLRSQDDRKFYLEGQLAQLNPLSPMYTDSGEKILDPGSKLKMLRSDYISASAKYSPDHPDVVRMRREIEGLEKQTNAVNSATDQAKELARLRVELSTLREKYSADHPDVIRLTKEISAHEEALKKHTPPETVVGQEKPENPAYITLQSQLDAVKGQILALTRQREDLRAKLTDYETRIQKTPEVERGYLGLRRDYENSVKRYQEIKAKQMDAEVGQELEKERKGERFSLIDPAQLPEEPIRPNRPLIIAFGFMLSTVGGLGFGIVAESVDSSVRGARGVISVLKAPPLSIIPYVRNRQDQSQFERRKKLAIRVAIGGFILIVILAHFLWTPLDLLWFRGLRKITALVHG